MHQIERPRTLGFCAAAARGGRGPRTVVLALCLAALALLSPLAAVAEGPTREEYVATLERICKPGSEATQRAVHGMRSDVRHERLRLAAAKFSRAKRIFAHTLREISVVPRPSADMQTLARWFSELGREKVYLGRIITALRASNVGRFQRASADFIRQGNRANDVVVTFGFNYCSFKPDRFQ